LGKGRKTAEEAEGHGKGNCGGRVHGLRGYLAKRGKKD